MCTQTAIWGGREAQGVEKATAGVGSISMVSVCASAPGRLFVGVQPQHSSVLGYYNLCVSLLLPF